MHVKLNPGSPWQKQNLTGKSLFICRKLVLNWRNKQVRCYICTIALCNVEYWTLRETDQKSGEFLNVADCVKINKWSIDSGGKEYPNDSYSVHKQSFTTFSYSPEPHTRRPPHRTPPLPKSSSDSVRTSRDAHITYTSPTPQDPHPTRTLSPTRTRRNPSISPRRVSCN
jgi:hypothetical protein